MTTLLLGCALGLAIGLPTGLWLAQRAHLATLQNLLTTGSATALGAAVALRPTEQVGLAMVEAAAGRHRDRGRIIAEIAEGLLDEAKLTHQNLTREEAMAEAERLAEAAGIGA